MSKFRVVPPSSPFSRASRHEAPKYTSVFDRLSVSQGVLTIDCQALPGVEKLHREGHNALQRYVRVPGVGGMQVGVKQADSKPLAVISIKLPSLTTRGWRGEGKTRTIRYTGEDSQGTPCEVYFRCNQFPED